MTNRKTRSEQVLEDEPKYCDIHDVVYDGDGCLICETEGFEKYD